MGEVAITIVRWTVKAGFVLALAIGIISLLAVITSYMVVGFSLNVLTDIIALVQIWLPFNLTLLLAWITITATVYIAYKLAQMAFNIFNNFAGS